MKVKNKFTGEVFDVYGVDMFGKFGNIYFCIYDSEWTWFLASDCEPYMEETVSVEDIEKETDRRVNEVLKKAIETYGEESQIVMCMEECAELIQACTKAYRSYGTPEHQQAVKSVIEEAADVWVMLRQIWLIFDPDDEKIRNMVSVKINRLAERLKGAE